MILAALFLLILAILEGSVISFPFVFLFLIFFSLRNRTPWVFIFAFLGGILLDSFYLRTIGFTSVFFLIFIFGVLLYERKFEIGSSFFLFASVLLGSFLYFSIFHGSLVWQKTLITLIFAGILSKIFLKPRLIID